MFIILTIIGLDDAPSIGTAGFDRIKQNETDTIFS